MGLSQRVGTSLVSTTTQNLRRVDGDSFLFVSLIHTCSRYTSTLYLQRSPPAALDRGSLEWFETRSWKLISKGPPSGRYNRVVATSLRRSSGSEWQRWRESIHV